MSKRRLGALLVGAVLLSVACGGGSSPEALEKRAQAFWDARVAKDHARAYAYLDPAWRAGFSMEQWAGFSLGIVEVPSCPVDVSVISVRSKPFSQQARQRFRSFS